jgi:tripartite-type tricarboxylate transporter receptor subunit TctC
MLARKLAEAWGQPVVVDNRPGASTAIGSEIVARAAPDGYTIMLCSVSFAVNAAARAKLPFDPVRDFAPITHVARVPQILLVNPSLPANSLKEFIALAKSKPGQLNYASAGNGSSTHLAMELLMELTGISMNHVPYKGTSPGMTDVIAGNVQATFNAIPPALPNIRSGKIRALGVANPRRFPTLPDVPTFDEAGVKGYTFSSWFGILAPARVPREIIGKLNTELVRIIRDPEISKTFIELGIEPLGTSPEEFGKNLRDDITRWSGLVKKRNIHTE